MRVLMISIERSLLGAGFSGDALERHKEYAERVEHLDMIVMTGKGFRKRILSPRLTAYPTNSSSKLNYIFDAIRLAREIYWQNKFDLIVCQDPFLNGLAGWLIKKRLKVPLLIHFHGDFWDNKYWLFEKKRWWFNWFFLLLSKFLVDGADGIRVVSARIKSKLVKAGVDKRKIRVVPTPVDIKKFKWPDPVEVKRIKNKNKKMIINVGRDDPSKDYPTLFKAIRLVYEKYKNFSFVQIGAGLDLKNEFRQLENIRLRGMKKIKQDKLINYYHAAEVYVSSSKHESFGKVLIEAMAAGLPIVATATTGSKEIIQDGTNGFLVPVGDREALARKVIYLLNNPRIAKEMGQNGRKMVEEKFNQEKIIKKMINFWEKLSKND